MILSPGACQSCPENGICYGGELQCLPGFNKHGRVCLRDQQAHKAVKAVVSLMLSFIFNLFVLAAHVFGKMQAFSHIVLTPQSSVFWLFPKHAVSRK